MPDYEHHTFARTLHDDYTVNFESGETLALTLAEVSALTQQNNCDRFSLVFKGPKSGILAQGSYALNHETEGVSHIFLVPIAEDEQHISYEAVFQTHSAS